MTSEPLRILIGADDPPDPNSGASGTIWQMARALRSRGHRVDTFWSRDLGRRIKHGNLHYLLELPRAYRREVRARTQTETYDVIELHEPHGFAAAADHQRREQPGVFVIRSQGHEVRAEEALVPWREYFGEDRRNPIKKMISAAIGRRLATHWDLSARNADGFVFSCQQDHDFMIERYGVSPDRVGLIPMGVPTKYLERALQPFTEERSQRLLYVGQLAFFKAPQVLGKAVSRILLEQPSATMTWVCSGHHHHKALSLVDPSVHQRVQLLDWMSQDELINVLDEHGLFLFPSFFEGFGKAPLEAMARGLCVVATETGGMKDFIDDGRSGRLVPVGEPERLACTVLELLDRPGECSRLASAARAAAEKLSWDHCARIAEQFYRALLRFKADR